MGETKRTANFVDGISFQGVNFDFFDLEKVKKPTEKGKINKTKSTLFSRGKRTDYFFTEDSKLYISPLEQEMIKKGIGFDKTTKKFDNVSFRVLRAYRQYRPDSRDVLYNMFLSKYKEIKGDLADKSYSFISAFSPAKAWKFSLIGAILFGMFSMTFIYRYLGQSVSADNMIVKNEEQPKVEYLDTTSKKQVPKVLGIEDAKNSGDYIGMLIEGLQEEKKDEFEEKMLEMVKGHPIEDMIPYIAEKDRLVAAFLIGIARKESNWGKRVPVLNGQDCYNYWGYRGIRKHMGSGGHTCFNSRKDAVDTVAKRIEWLTKNKKLDTPEKMIIWKCGSSCDGHSRESVRKWISDVSIYFDKLNKQ